MGGGEKGTPIDGRKQIGNWGEKKTPLPIPSMYGISSNIYHEHQPNVGKYTNPMDGMGYVPFFSPLKSRSGAHLWCLPENILIKRSNSKKGEI